MARVFGTRTIGITFFNQDRAECIIKHGTFQDPGIKTCPVCGAKTMFATESSCPNCDNHSNRLPPGIKRI